MRLRIHRGTKEIGGTCIEAEAQGKRLVLDVGLPLDASDDAQETLLPEPSMLVTSRPNTLVPPFGPVLCTASHPPSMLQHFSLSSC